MPLFTTKELATAKGVGSWQVYRMVERRRIRPFRGKRTQNNHNVFTEAEAVKYLFQRTEITKGKILAKWSASFGSPLYILKEDRAIYCDRMLYHQCTDEWILVKVLPEDTDIDGFIEDLKMKGNIVL